MNPFLTPSRRRRELIAFFLLAHAFLWAVEIPIALSQRGLIAVRVPLAVHYIASFGPFLAALVVTLVAEGLPVGVVGVRSQRAVAQILF